ncbi:hypothetical protein AWH48_11490 [Domibacillus aminovorans]|uniref:Uncharacterized protein n=1 Tax=Domibacillus aminovorans TaxID=29332 RepID=A0A177KLP2_9BACI|nr:hypothetical protein [Domibacillus aminovorans]OAH53886.1 hypothetical protein AWH48_11490 [Domibacillus aminovorans]
MEGHEWSVRLYVNPGIVGWNLSPHFYFWNGEAEFGDIDPSFSSHHVNVLSLDEVDRAYSRIKTLLRIINGVCKLTDRSFIKSSTTLEYFEKNHFSAPNYREDMNILIEELENPFDEKVVGEIRDREREKWIFQGGKRPYIPGFDEFMVDESIDNPTARNILLWLSLGEEELLYFMINAYKIMDSIKTETGVLQKGNQDASLDNLKVAAKKMQTHSHYMNTKAASGILSRHGEKPEAPPKNIPTIEEMKQDLVMLVSEWFKYQFIIKYNVQPKE